MSETQPIPKQAWQSVGDPGLNMYDRCWTCGGENVRTLSMAGMLSVPRERRIDAHTFMVPNVAWGYLQCDDCERRQEQGSWAWWERLLHTFGKRSLALVRMKQKTK
jgi:hypothetical protein